MPTPRHRKPAAPAAPPGTKFVIRLADGRYFWYGRPGDPEPGYVAPADRTCRTQLGAKKFDSAEAAHYRAMTEGLTGYAVVPWERWFQS